MSSWQSMRLVAERELRETMRRRSFWLIVGVVFAASLAAVFLPEVLGGERATYQVAVVDGSPALNEQLEAVADSLDVDLELSVADSLRAATDLMAEDEVDVAIVVDDRPTVIAKADQAESFVATVQQVVGVRALADRLEAQGVDPDELGQALEESTARVVRLDQDEVSREASAGIVAALLYVLLLMLMILVSNGVAIEKANRISEVLLAIVRPGPLLFGKVIGVGLIGIATLTIALLPPVARLALGGDLPPGLGSAIVAGGPWLLLGLVLYLTTAGALGALVERQEEAGTVVMPVTILLVGSLLVAQSASDSPLGHLLAIFPFTSPMVMPALIAVGEASAVEMVVSLAVGVATVVLVLRLGARVYARGIVHTGRRLKVREVLT